MTTLKLIHNLIFHSYYKLDFKKLIEGLSELRADKPTGEATASSTTASGEIQKNTTAREIKKLMIEIILNK